MARFQVLWTFQGITTVDAPSAEDAATYLRDQRNADIVDSDRDVSLEIESVEVAK